MGKTRSRPNRLPNGKVLVFGLERDLERRGQDDVE